MLTTIVVMCILLKQSCVGVVFTWEMSKTICEGKIRNKTKEQCERQSNYACTKLLSRLKNA